MSTKNEFGRFHPVNGVRCKYLRDREGNPVGLVMTKVEEDVFRVGWSLCNTKLDSFRKSTARRMAEERLSAVVTTSGNMLSALEYLAESADVPHSIRRGCREEIMWHNHQVAGRELDRLFGDASP